MAPLAPIYHRAAQAAKELREQWKEPTDIFSVLLILGGDVINLALAQVSGGIFTPVVFSFGWVAYAVTSLLSVMGENKLIRCGPEISSKVINLGSGYARSNQSWVLSRIMKDYEHWMPQDVRFRACNATTMDGIGTYEVATGAHSVRQPPGLCAAVYRFSDRPGLVAKPGHDWVWWSGVAVSLVQLGIAAIPCGLYRDWSIPLVTTAGTVLAYASGALPQWKLEKWSCRVGRSKDIAITKGNGSLHVIIVLGEDGKHVEKNDGVKRKALDLEDLASDRSESLAPTRIYSLLLVIAWLLLLITSTGIQENTWYLLLVGLIGMLHNIVIAAAPRDPAMLGIPIDLVRNETGAAAVFGEEKVMWTLMALEKKYPNSGRHLVHEFFPGTWLEWEKTWWETDDAVMRDALLGRAKTKYYDKKKQEAAAAAATDPSFNHTL